MRWIAIVLFMLPLMAQANVYKWVDNQGNTHYSDTQHTGSSKMELPTIGTYQAPELATENESQQADAQQMEGPHQYNDVIIQLPADQTTLRSSQGEVQFVVELGQPLLSGDVLQVLLDGRPFGGVHQTTTFTISGIYRGSHSLAVVVLGAKGKVLGQSAPITLFMHNPRANMVKPKS